MNVGGVSGQCLASSTPMVCLRRENSFMRLMVSDLSHHSTAAWSYHLLHFALKPKTSVDFLPYRLIPVGQDVENSTVCFSYKKLHPVLVLVLLTDNGDLAIYYSRRDVTWVWACGASLRPCFVVGGYIASSTGWLCGFRISALVVGGRISPHCGDDKLIHTCRYHQCLIC
jgi:hypothetical protein